MYNFLILAAEVAEEVEKVAEVTTIDVISFVIAIIGCVFSCSHIIVSFVAKFNERLHFDLRMSQISQTCIELTIANKSPLPFSISGIEMLYKGMCYPLKTVGKDEFGNSELVLYRNVRVDGDESISECLYMDFDFDTAMLANSKFKVRTNRRTVYKRSSK